MTKHPKKCFNDEGGLYHSTKIQSGWLESTYHKISQLYLYYVTRCHTQEDARKAYTNKPMITTYPTCRTVDNRNLRSGMLSLTHDASHFLQNLGMNLRVDGMGSLRLLGGWLFNDDIPQVVDDSPYAGALGIVAFKDNPVIGERKRSWSHSIRRKKGLRQT